ncbi:MAG: DUF1540 domain-containing protein [Deltaproteobacteria bacterium]|nr:DUF1540 domain-containing protein [Deltaproteobacteria bacterium]
MKITVEMPQVSKCTATNCAYNVKQGCHARAITIGDGNQANCDSHFDSSPHTKANARVAGVGACKVTGCKYNDDFECNAQAINVGYVGQAVKCMTFAARS